MLTSSKLGATTLLFCGTFACSLPVDQSRAGALVGVVANQYNSDAKAPAQLPLPRDPQIAVQEEYDAAKSEQSLAGWELFLQRHADNKLAVAARWELDKIVAAEKKVSEKK